MINTVYNYPKEIKKVVAGLIQVSNKGYKTTQTLHELIEELKQESADVEGFEVTKLEDFLTYDDNMQEQILSMIYEFSHNTKFSCVHGVCYFLLEEISLVEQRALFKKMITKDNTPKSTEQDKSDSSLENNKEKEKETEEVD